MEDYQKRVVDEQAELAKKLTALNEFICSESYKSLSVFQQRLLFYQAKAMGMYSEILWDRISDFTEEI